MAHLPVDHLPLMRRAIAINSVLVSVQTLNTFESILALTGGGPGRATEVLSLFTFTTVFYNLDLAGGSALAVLLFAMGMRLTILIGWLRQLRGPHAGRNLPLRRPLHLRDTHAGNFRIISPS